MIRPGSYANLLMYLQFSVLGQKQRSPDQHQRAANHDSCSKGPSSLKQSTLPGKLLQLPARQVGRATFRNGSFCSAKSSRYVLQARHWSVQHGPRSQLPKHHGTTAWFMLDRRDKARQHPDVMLLCWEVQSDSARAAGCFFFAVPCAWTTLLSLCDERHLAHAPAVVHLLVPA